MAGTVGLQGRAPGYRWVVISLWFVCGMTAIMMISTLGILLPAISDDLHLSPGQQGALSSAAFWGTLVLAIPLSWWTSRYSPKILTTVTLALGVLLLILQGWAPAFAVLLVGRMGFGITNLAREPARALLTQQWFTRREVILVNSVSNVFFGIVVGAGLVLTPYILGVFEDNWRTVLYIYAAFFAGLTVLWMALGRERVTEEYQRREIPREAGLLKGALNYRDLWVAGLGFLGANMAGAAFVSFYPTLMLDEYNVSLQWSGVVLAMGIFVGGIGGLGVGIIVMQMDRRRNILQALGILMLGTYIGMISVGFIPLLMLFSFLNGVAWGFWPILQTVPFQLTGIRPREVAVALGFIIMAIAAGFSIGPLATGFLQEAFGDLKLALFIVSFASLALTASGILLRIGGARGLVAEGRGASR